MITIPLCPRCGGTFTPEWLSDVHTHGGFLLAWRCMNCGEVVDAAILEARTQPPPVLRHHLKGHRHGHRKARGGKHPTNVPPITIKQKGLR